jgi:PEP-CTERM motif
MIMKFRNLSRLASVSAAALALAATGQASAALTVFQTFTGNLGLSTDGCGTATTSCSIQAFVPVGATVTGAWLYQTTFGGPPATAQPISFNGNALAFSPFVVNTSQPFLGSARADVTAAVAAIVNPGLGGTYNFTVGEGSSGTTDGTALVVVYSLASLAESTVTILDGFASTTGDTATINFAAPLNTTAPGFTADVRLGIGFSAGSSAGQTSTVRVNGTLISSHAGGFDDGASANGQLITVGGNNDPFSPFLPANSVADTERYNLIPQIANGSTSITFNTANTSNDDNIFLLAGIFSGRATVTTAIPEPGTWAMMLAGFGIVGGAMRRRQRTSVSFA